MRYPGFIGPSNESASVIADQERTVNFYFEPAQSRGSTSESYLYPTPGVTSLGSGTTGPGRAHFAEDGREWAVIGEEFGEIAQDGTFTASGTVATDSNPATISSNGEGGGQLFITSGGNGYSYDISTDTLAAIAFLAGKATIGDQLDGYFLALDADTATMYISDLLDATTWDPTQFAQRSIASDPWISMKVLGRYIWLFGTHTSEVWYDAGTAPFPFAPYPSVLVPYGCAASFSPVEAEGALVWMARSQEGQGYVLQASGFQPERISTYAVELALQSYDVISDAVGDAYDEAGHTFYLLHIPDGNITWCWDSQTRTWTERGTWISEENRYVPLRTRYHVFEFGEHRWLDSETASIYQSSISLGTDIESRPIRRLRRAPALVRENQWLFYSSFELLLDVGLGGTSDPQVMMRFSDDGGRTWSTQLFEGAGASGEYGTRVHWHRLGAARKRVFEIVMTDSVPWRIVDAYIEGPNLQQRSERVA